MHPLAPILCATVPAAVCVAAHYFPWRYFFRRGRLPRLAAYALGVLAILGPATVAMLLAAQTVEQAAGLLWLSVASAAIGTAVPWWHDEHKRNELAAQDAMDSEYADYAE